MISERDTGAMIAVCCEGDFANFVDCALKFDFRVGVGAGQSRKIPALRTGTDHVARYINSGFCCFRGTQLILERLLYIIGIEFANCGSLLNYIKDISHQRNILHFEPIQRTKSSPNHQNIILAHCLRVKSQTSLNRPCQALS